MVNILVFDLRVQLQHCTCQRKTLLFALIKVSTFICKREISGLSSPFNNWLLFYLKAVITFTLYTSQFFFKDAGQQDGGRRKRNTNIKETEAELDFRLILVLQCYSVIWRNPTYKRYNFHSSRKFLVGWGSGGGYPRRPRDIPNKNNNTLLSRDVTSVLSVQMVIKCKWQGKLLLQNIYHVRHSNTWSCLRSCWKMP